MGMEVTGKDAVSKKLSVALWPPNTPGAGPPSVPSSTSDLATPLGTSSG